MSIEFNVMPCASGMPKNNSYAREIVTPRGTLQTPAKLRRKRHKLTKQDVYMILQDAKYQPGKEPKISSPVLLVPDWKVLQSGTATFGVGQNMSITFTLAPNAQKWEFGLLDTPKRRNNREFSAFVKTLL